MCDFRSYTDSPSPVKVKHINKANDTVTTITTVVEAASKKNDGPHPVKCVPHCGEDKLEILLVFPVVEVDGAGTGIFRFPSSMVRSLSLRKKARGRKNVSRKSSRPCIEVIEKKVFRRVLLYCFFPMRCSTTLIHVYSSAGDHSLHKTSETNGNRT